MRIWFNRTFSNIYTVLELIRQGDTMGEFQLICTHDSPGFPGFLQAHEYALEPKIHAPEDYLDFCLEFCAERHIDAFAPGRHSIGVSEQTSRFAAQGVKVLNAASPEQLRILHNKARFYAATRESSVPSPDFRVFTDLQEFESGYGELRTRHPVLCIKPVEGVYGIGFRVIDERHKGLELLLSGQVEKIPLVDLRRWLEEAECCRPMLLMEYLNGVEYSADCVGDGRRVLQMVQRCKPSAGVYGQQIVDVSEISACCRELASSYGLKGMFNAQFREGRRGLRVLEVNPRFSGGIGMSSLSGINLPYLAIRGQTHGFPEPVSETSAVGLRVLDVSQAVKVNASAP